MIAKDLNLYTYDLYDNMEHVLKFEENLSRDTEYLVKKTYLHKKFNLQSGHEYHGREISSPNTLYNQIKKHVQTFFLNIYLFTTSTGMEV